MAEGAQPYARAQQAAQAAARLITFADGLEEAGMATYARRARAVARETIWLAHQLESEHTSRQAMQKERDRILDLWMARVAGRDLPLTMPPEDRVA